MAQVVDEIIGLEKMPTEFRLRNNMEANILGSGS